MSRYPRDRGRCQAKKSSTPSSIAVMQDMNSIADVREASRTSLQVGDYRIGEIKWLPSGSRSRMLYCHTMYDVLSALL